MASAFTTYHPVNGKEPLLRRMVCEVRYRDGQLYLDHCGRLLKGLLKDGAEWMISPDPTPQGTSLYNIVAGTQLGFSVNAASLTLDKSSGDEVIDTQEAEEFCRQVESVLGFVLDELEASELSRVGYREFYYFSCESKEACAEWLQGLGLFTLTSGLHDSFKAQPEALGLTVILQGQDCRYRIGLNGTERWPRSRLGQRQSTFLPVPRPQGKSRS